jgi:hypothetical protein
MVVDTVLDGAKSAINGSRRNAYGPYSVEAEKIATGWSEILGFEVPARKVPLCMIWMKLIRESNKHGLDNLVDTAGYAALTRQLTGNGGDSA